MHRQTIDVSRRSPGKTLHVVVPKAPLHEKEEAAEQENSKPTNDIHNEGPAGGCHAPSKSSVAHPPAPPRVPDLPTPDHLFVNRKQKLHDTLHKVQKSSSALERTLIELDALQSRVELGFLPALEQMKLDDERLRSDLDRRLAITEKLIRNEIEKKQAPVKQHAKLLKQQLMSVNQCEEIAKHVLKLEKPYLIRAYPRVEIEAKQVLDTYKALNKLEMPTVEAITPKHLPKR